MSSMREIEMSEAGPSSESPLTFAPSFAAALEAPAESAIPHPRMTSTRPIKRGGPLSGINNAQTHHQRNLRAGSGLTVAPEYHQRRQRAGLSSNRVGKKTVGMYNPGDRTDHRRPLAVEKHKSQGHHALVHFQLISQNLGSARHDILSRKRLRALRKLFRKDLPLPRLERDMERERVAREEAIKELEVATATAKNMKKAQFEGERRSSV